MTCKQITNTALFISLSLMLSTISHASEFVTEDLSRDENNQETWIVLPYIFSSESMGTTVGAVGIFAGYVQPQMSFVGTVFAGEELEIQHNEEITPEFERTAGFLFAMNSYRPHFSNRLFISAMGAYGYYPNQQLYLDGGNDSEKDLGSSNHNSLSPMKTQGYNNWFNGNFRFVLPWGEGENTILPNIQLQRGIAVNRDNVGGGKPFSTGQTTLGGELFYTKWSAEKFLEAPELNTNGLRLYLEHNNTDYPSNPSRGYSFTGKVSADFGVGNSTQSWNALEFDYSQYIELQNFSWTKQSVVALNFWSAYSPSWDHSNSMVDGGALKAHQTPMWEGARLGGWTRMRAYDNNRFNDKAAIYGAIEYRLIPHLNPISDFAWNPISIDWLQVVVFAEAGRVAEKYHLDLLLSDMKYDVGFSLRVLAAKVPVCFEMALGEEGSAWWLMLQQPF